MTALSDIAIRRLCNPSSYIRVPLITPYNPENLQPCSYDLCVDSDVSLEPLEFRLLSTVEEVCLPADLQGQIYGRSSIGRLGVFVHISAGFVDAGFRGNLTLECFNASTKPWFCLRGVRVAQISFYKLDQPAAHPYKGRYQDQVGVTPSRL
jgi:dCTP deaminase